MQLDEAVSAMERSPFDVMLLCYSVRKQWRTTLVHKFRDTCRDGRIVAITDQPLMQIPNDVDQVVYGIDGPDALMRALRGKAA